MITVRTLLEWVISAKIEKSNSIKEPYAKDLTDREALEKTQPFPAEHPELELAENIMKIQAERYAYDLYKDLSRMDNKNEIMSVLGYKSGEWDYSLPQAWFNLALEKKINTHDFVWLYDDNNKLFGRPFNYKAEFVKKAFPFLASQSVADVASDD